MNIFVIVIEFYVSLKKNFKVGINQISIIFHDFNKSTTENKMFAEACLLTGTSHFLLVIGPSI